jgi:protein gp37
VVSERKKWKRLENPIALFEAYEPIHWVFNGKEAVTPYPFGFSPTFHRYRLGDPAKAKEPQTVFIGSMTDLFGEWIPDEWIEAVFDACAAAPWHTYMFLTKNPQGMAGWMERNAKASCGFANSFGLDCDKPYYGATATCGADLGRILELPRCVNKFVSVEPLLGPIPWDLMKYAVTNQSPAVVIIGAETGSRNKAAPLAEWVDEIVDACEHAYPAPMIFMKDSLIPIVGRENMRRELPWGK